MTDITTPAQMREAVEQAVLAEKMRMMSWCAKRQAVSRKAWERAARKALAGDMADLRNRIALIDAEPLDIVQSDAGDDALPVADPLCTWPSCGHTAKGQCRTYTSGQLIAPNDASITATNMPVAEQEPQAAKVKPLQWVFHDATRNYSAVYISDGWTISRKGTGHFVLYNREFNEGMDRAYQTLETAKAAAEADHAARILSQIDAVSVAQVRAEALEEAAKLADAITERLWHEYKTERHFATDHLQGMSDGAGEVADAIRALMEKPE